MMWVNRRCAYNDTLRARQYWALRLILWLSLRHPMPTSDGWPVIRNLSHQNNTSQSTGTGRYYPSNSTLRRCIINILQNNSYLHFRLLPNNLCMQGTRITRPVRKFLDFLSFFSLFSPLHFCIVAHLYVGFSTWSRERLSSAAITMKLKIRTLSNWPQASHFSRVYFSASHIRASP